MKTERELFEEWADSNSYYLHKNTDGSYEKGSTAMAWEIWQASANREGYKLVPENHECKWCGCTEIGGFEK